MRRVAAGDGIGVVPQSVAKALRRRDVVAFRLEDADPAEVALAWPRESENAWVDEFIGIVRGRTAHSSRNPDVAAAEAADAREKEAAKTRSGPAKAGAGQAGSGKARTGSARSGSKSSHRGKGAARKGRR